MRMMYQGLFNHVGERLCCLQFGAVTNKAAANICTSLSAPGGMGSGGMWPRGGDEWRWIYSSFLLVTEVPRGHSFLLSPAPVTCVRVLPSPYSAKETDSGSSAQGDTEPHRLVQDTDSG